jgi:hypothetical protein
MIGEPEISSGQRRRHLGEGMLTPTSTFTFQGETYEAGVTNVVPEHPVARSEHARLLKPAYAKEASHEVLRFLERQRAEGIDPQRPHRAPHDYLGRPSWRLGPTPGREPWRLG